MDDEEEEYELIYDYQGITKHTVDLSLEITGFVK